MLILLPLFTVILLFLDLLGLQKQGTARLSGWRIAIIHAALITGLFIALQSGILSLFHALSQPYLVGFWSLALLIVILMGIRRRAVVLGWNRFTASFRQIGRFSALTLAAFGIIVILLLVIVTIAPQNNIDSLQYHMSRVMHWVQDRSLAHYPAGFEAQLINPIGAELAVLQLHLFLGSDQLASLPQWLSLILCAIVVSLAADLFGASRKGQLIAAAFAISIPMGLLQATSTQNDYLAALWLSILALFVLDAWKREPGWPETLSISAALGLGLLTKGTFYPFAIAWLVWLVASWLKRKQFPRMLISGMVMVAIVIILNAGYWTRNLITYRNPLGPPEWIASMTSAEKGILKPYVANLVKDVVLNFATPSYELNGKIAATVRDAFLSVDPIAGKFQLMWRWNHEDIAGNPIQLVLVTVVFGSILFTAIRRKGNEPNRVWYALAVIFSFLLFVLVTHFDQFGVRYQLPLLVISAPLVGLVISRVNERRLAPLAIIFFVVISLPYVFFNSTRPLIAMKAGPEPFAIPVLPGLGNTRSSSIFFANPTDLLFANWPEMEKPYVESVQAILTSGCNQVGLRIDSRELEYPFWRLLNAPESGVRIESIYYSSVLNRYADPNFKPCAIVCTICGGRNRLYGLDLIGSYDNFINLYIGDTYSPDIDH